MATTWQSFSRGLRTVGNAVLGGAGLCLLLLGVACCAVGYLLMPRDWVDWLSSRSGLPSASLLPRFGHFGASHERSTTRVH
jgi:hypothetical protein